MEINIALDNFKRAYNDLIDALEGQTDYQPIERNDSDVTLNKYLISSDIGPYMYLAQNETHAKNQFRAEHGFRHIKINRVTTLETNVDKAKQL